MSTVNDTSSLAVSNLGSSGYGSQATNSRKELGQDDFLALMVAQLKSQDPFNPMQNGEFLSQLAQFGTVNGIQALQASFGELGASLQSMQALQASSLVGRGALVRNDTGYLGAESPLQGVVDLPANASQVTVTITDANGALVREIQLGGQAAGRTEFAWDGLTDRGTQAAPGEYRVTANAEIGGQAGAADVMVKTTVESVTLGQGGRGMTLNAAGVGPLTLDQVMEIY